MIFRFITFFYLLFVSFPGFATPLSPEAQLRKLSLHLRGIPPSTKELQDIGDAQNPKSHLHTKAREYMEDERFIRVMTDHLDTLFKMRVSFHRKDDNAVWAQFTNNSMNYLFHEIMANNLSWDNLLTHKTYKLSTRTGSHPDDFNASESSPDVEFFGYIFSDQLTELRKTQQLYTTPLYFYDNQAPGSPPTEFRVRAESVQQKSAVAGALSTDRFFKRYPTTKINRNRTRAAAVFRIFLCDDMVPVILPSKNGDSKLLMLALGSSEKQVSNPIDQAIRENKHGSDKSCASCHYKLDPLGKVFNGSSRILNKASKGALVYRDNSGKVVNIPVAGLGELGEVIVQRPEYVSCQVSHFWNWFIGKDVPLTPSKHKLLVQEFDRVSRKPKDFIQLLVTSKDFYSSPKLTLEDVNFQHVKPLFKRCDSCHAEDPLAPTLLEFPNLGSLAQERLARSVFFSLNLDGSQHKQEMPPENAGWNLSSRETLMVKAWILGGAKTPNGETTIRTHRLTKLRERINGTDSFDVNSLLIKTPTLDTTFYRYMSGNTLLDSLSVFFHSYFGPDCLGNKFKEIAYHNLGKADPTTGKPKNLLPNSSYLDQIGVCFDSHTQLKRDVLKQVVPDKNRATIDSYNALYDYSPQDISELVRNIYNRTIGFGVLDKDEEERLLRQEIEKAQLILEGENRPLLRDLAARVFFSFILQPSFLVY
jgi:hypothetical protein